MPTIVRDSPTPYYVQLFEILRDGILSQRYHVDDRLPSEQELCREYGLSRATVRQALSKLEGEGLARRVAGRGFFAADRSEVNGWSVQDADGFLELQLRHGRTGVTTQVLSSEYEVPAEHARLALGLGSRDRVLALKRVRSLDGEIAMYSTNWFPEKLAPIIESSEDVLSGSGSVNVRLRSAGYTTESAHRIIEAVPASPEVANCLEISIGTPVLRIRSLGLNQAGVKFDYYETWVLTDVLPLEVNVANSSQ